MAVNIPVAPEGSRPDATGADASKFPSAADAALDAEKRALARERAAKIRTARRYQQASADLQGQIRALRDAIRNEFARSRKQNIRDLDLMLSQQLGQLKEGAALRGAEFLTAASDAEKATGDVQEAGIRNAVRERADSMTAILEQGAGETDAVRAMLVNARNWHANSAEASRTYFDTMQSINQGITDLNVDTKAALSNAHMYTEGQKELAWQDFYNRRAEAMSSLGDTYGRRLEYLAQAKELGIGAKTKKNPNPVKSTAGTEASARKGMNAMYAASANELGKSYVQKPLPDWIEKYEGTATVDRRQESTNLASAPVFEGVQRAQGATLRKWAA